MAVPASTRFYLNSHLGQPEFALKIASNFACLHGTPAHESVRAALARVGQARAWVLNKLPMETTRLHPDQAPLGAVSFCSSTSGKLCSFPDNNSMPKITQSIDAKVIRSIRAKRSASAFSAKDFSRFGSRVAVWQALNRLARSGKVRRIRQGLYDLPRAHPLLGQTAPDAMAVVRGLMKGSNAQWQVSGPYAANLLGLSEQVPAKIVILTDGVPRRVPLGKLTLVFQRAAPRNLLGAGQTAGLVVQAVRHLRASGMTPAMIARLRRQLDGDTKADLAALTPDLPAWMQPIVWQIADRK